MSSDDKGREWTPEPTWDGFWALGDAEDGREHIYERRQNQSDVQVRIYHRDDARRMERALAGLNPEGVKVAAKTLRRIAEDGCHGGTADDEWECGRNLECPACAASKALTALGVTDD